MTVLVPAAALAPVPPSSAMAASAATGPGGFTPVTPSRILDTRIGLGAPAIRVGSGRSIDVQVTGMAGVPATGAGPFP